MSERIVEADTNIGVGKLSQFTRIDNGHIFMDAHLVLGDLGDVKIGTNVSHIAVDEEAILV